MNFLIIQETKPESLFVLLDELLLAFHINFHHQKFFNELQLIFTFKDCRRIKGLLHPWPVFGLFMYVSQKLQHIGSK